MTNEQTAWGFKVGELRKIASEELNCTGENGYTDSDVDKIIALAIQYINQKDLSDFAFFALQKAKQVLKEAPSKIA